MWRAILVAIGIVGGSAWGSPTYGDPPGWCTNHSDMWTTTIVTNDPLVGTNPERATFYGFHPNPGYDDWYGYVYAPIPGRPIRISRRRHLRRRRTAASAAAACRACDRRFGVVHMGRRRR